MKVIEKEKIWLYTHHPVCEVCGDQLNFVPVLLKDGYKVCPACAGIEVEKYFYRNTIVLWDCCQEGNYCPNYFDALSTWRKAAEFAIRRGKPRDVWRVRYWRSQVKLHELCAQRREIVERIERDLTEEYRHWLLIERPPVEVAMANINHVVSIAEFITQGHVDADRLREQLEEAVHTVMEEGGAS